MISISPRQKGSKQPNCVLRHSRQSTFIKRPSDRPFILPLTRKLSFLLSNPTSPGSSVHILQLNLHSKHFPPPTAKMSSPTHTFLTLIPATHRVATISPFTSPVDESVVPVLQKTRRSSSTTSAESNSAADEPALPTDIVESPVDAVTGKPAEQAAAHQFLRLGN